MDYSVSLSSLIYLIVVLIMASEGRSLEDIKEALRAERMKRSSEAGRDDAGRSGRRAYPQQYPADPEDADEELDEAEEEEQEPEPEEQELPRRDVGEDRETWEEAKQRIRRRQQQRREEGIYYPRYPPEGEEEEDEDDEDEDEKNDKERKPSDYPPDKPDPRYRVINHRVPDQELSDPEGGPELHDELVPPAELWRTLRDQLVVDQRRLVSYFSTQIALTYTVYFMGPHVVGLALFPREYLR